MTEIESKEYMGTKIVSVYGGTKVLSTYHVVTTCEMIKNEYKVVFEIAGLHTAEPFFRLHESRPTTNNEHTLGLEDLRDIIE